MGVAQRASMLRAAGVPLIEYLDVTAEVYRQFMLKVRGVLDEEREKMSWIMNPTRWSSMAQWKRQFRYIE